MTEAELSPQEIVTGVLHQLRDLAKRLRGQPLSRNQLFVFGDDDVVSLHLARIVGEKGQCCGIETIVVEFGDSPDEHTVHLVNGWGYLSRQAGLPLPNPVEDIDTLSALSAELLCAVVGALPPTEAVVES